MGPVTTFLLRWLFLSSLIDDQDELQSVPFYHQYGVHEYPQPQSHTRAPLQSANERFTSQVSPTEGYGQQFDGSDEPVYDRQFDGHRAPLPAYHADPSDLSAAMRHSSRVSSDMKNGAPSARPFATSEFHRAFPSFRPATEREWQMKCRRDIAMYPPGISRLLALDTIRTGLVQRLLAKLRSADKVIADGRSHTIPPALSSYSQSQSLGSQQLYQGEMSDDVCSVPIPNDRMRMDCSNAQHADSFNQSVQTRQNIGEAMGAQGNGEYAERGFGRNSGKRVFDGFPVDGSGTADVFDEINKLRAADDKIVPSNIGAHSSSSLLSSQDNTVNATRNLEHDQAIDTEEIMRSRALAENAAAAALRDAIATQQKRTAQELLEARLLRREIRDFLPQLVSTVLHSPPALTSNLDPLFALRNLLVTNCIQNPDMGIELCWLLEAEVGRSWKALFEHRQQTVRVIITKMYSGSIDIAIITEGHSIIPLFCTAC